MEVTQLLLEIEDVIRTAPSRGRVSDRSPTSLQWLGRVGALVDQLPPGDSVKLPMSSALRMVGQPFPYDPGHVATVISLLYQLRWRYVELTKGSTSLAVNTGMVFAYFDGITKVLKTARVDVLFVDPYLDDEFLGRFLPFVDN